MRLNFAAARQLTSQLDRSVNWIVPYAGSTIETRFVYKPARDNVIAYVSSHNGCRMGCAFCHLTAQNRTQFTAMDAEGYTQQLAHVLDHWKSVKAQDMVSRVNVNFMAMGEPLANPTVVLEYPPLYSGLLKTASAHQLQMKPNISTIMPHTMRDRSLADVFQDQPAHLYYSLYSLSDKFRARWLPRALPWQHALDKIETWQYSSPTWRDHSSITFHWCFIANHNDTVDEVNQLATELRSRRFSGAKFNLVRFNPHASMSAQEPSQQRLEECFEQVNAALGNHPRSYIVPRVGRDVYASCGMFEEQ